MILTFDCETTTYEKGNPFSRRNKLCAVGIHTDDDDQYREYAIEYDSTPYGPKLREIAELFGRATLLVGFNIKFDLHWIRRYLELPNLLDLRVWDCQLGEFLLSGQRQSYPSLDLTCVKYGLDGKISTVAEQYWSKGIDTPDVPWDTLAEYLKQDVLQTRKVYDWQQRVFPRDMLKLAQAQNLDLVVLQDTEFNGMLYDVKESQRLAIETEAKLKEIDELLYTSFPSYPDFNWNSSDHLSCLIYGGVYYYRSRVPTARVLKSGDTKHGEKWGWEGVTFPKLASPPKRSETLPTREWDDNHLNGLNRERLDKGQRPICRVYKTDDTTLRSLKGSKRLTKLIEALRQRSELEKLLSTYYKGLPDLITKKDWPDDEIHGQFNQVVAATGRLSSSGPNTQNFAGDIKELFYSRYS
jgi:DNA polymerase I-like protein with 3'-5' exonuclease and polymerase domains